MCYGGPVVIKTARKTVLLTHVSTRVVSCWAGCVNQPMAIS